MTPRIRVHVSFTDDPFYIAHRVLSSSPKLAEINDWCLDSFGARPKINGHYHNYTNPDDRDKISVLFHREGHGIVFDFIDSEQAMMFKLAWG